MKIFRPTQIRKEIEAWDWVIEWLKTRTKKGVCFILLLLVVIFLIADFKNYYINQRKAFKVYPEILANVNEVDVFIDEWADASGVTMAFSQPKVYWEESQLVFKHERFNEYYDSFNKPNLDIQINNFYINLEKYKPKFLANHLIPLKEQGDDVIKKMDYYFGCKDFFHKEKKAYNVISADASVSTFSIVRYLRYKFK